MSYVKITELPAATVPLDYTELTAIVQNDVTKKVPLSNIVSVNVVNFVGTGAQTNFLLPSNVSESSTNVFVNGVYQQRNTYQISVDTLIFSEAPPTTSKIEVLYA